jgi:hypothetical protein
MTAGLRLILLLFALVGYTGAGASLAVSRHRHAVDGESDVGMLAVAVMLFVFGSLCTAVAAGMIGVMAFGAVILWISYVATAQRIGLFRVEGGNIEVRETEEPRQPK